MSDDISLTEAEAQAGIVRCDACPVLCRIRPGRAGACDRYANENGALVRVDPLVLLALVLWAVYVVLLWGRMRRGWGGSKASWLAIIGLVLLFVIRFAAIPYLSNFHKYGA